ncbi:MAG: macro domain-containing protein [Bacillota bacterium]|nr:macro domain-containing protein [Bacillota bacterium]
MEKIISEVKIETTKGDIASQPDITAVVNAANSQLRIGGGVAGAIHIAAGPALSRECRQYAPINPGEAVITGGHKLPNAYVIHCLGPVYGKDKPESKLLALCYENALTIAEAYKIDSVAFPAISTGAFGYPIEEATEVVFSVLKEMIPKLEYIKLIRFVLYSQKTLDIYEKYFNKIIKSR